MVALIIVGERGQGLSQSVSTNISVFAILPCDFEEGTTCQWLQGVGDDFDWTLHSGETPSGFTGPPYDHTKGNDNGHYLYTEASDPQQRGDVAHIISPYILPSLTDSCTVTFFYHMFGYHIGALRVLLQTLGNDTPQVVWEQQGQVGDRWVEVEVNLTSFRTAVFQVVIEGEIGSYQGDIAIDDISFSPGCERIEEGSVRLEDGTTPNEGRVEIFHNGAWGTVCNSGWTEQSASITCRQGGYKQAVSSGTRFPGQPATPIWLSDVVCTGEEEELADCDRSVWGQTGTCTHSMDVSVECSGFRPFCPTVHNECLNGQCVPRDRWCDFTDDCGDQTDEQQCASYPGRCDFQHGLCDWIQPDQDDADWIRHSGSTPTSNTGPTADHLGSTSSYYLYLEASDSGHRDKALLAYPHTFRPSSSCKVRFYYHIYGRDAGYLRVFLTTSHGSRKVWELRGEQGNNWHRGVVPLSSDKNFQIYIEGEVGSSHIGDIGLDDVSLSDDCVLANDSCETNGGPVFTCGIGGCVPGESRCDFTWNCADGSDETNCDDILGRCDFETDLCSWQQNREDSADFTRARGADVQGQQLPVTDHTFDSFIGYYVFVINASPGPTNTRRAKLKSTIQLGQSVDCSLRFYYHFSGRSASNISVVMMEANTGLMQQVWVKPREETPAWTFANVMLRGPFLVFTVSLSVSLDLSLEGAVAVDDISFSPSCIQGNLTHVRTTTTDRNEATTKEDASSLVTTTTFDLMTKPPDSGGLATGPLVGIVVGSLVFLVIMVACVVYFARSGKHPSALSQRNTQRDEPDSNDYDQNVQYTTGSSQINLTDIGAPNMDDQGYATLTETTHEYQALQFQPPHRFICPFTKSIMVEPVTASDGYTYDRTEIEGWLIRNQTSPSTNQKLTDFTLVPNLALKAEIDKYQAAAADRARPSAQGKTSPRLTNISV
ncbi:MAM and LDL-receptor class A domain-containing protein 1-like [Branchiostoma floridae]|uniref:MAM and LDL-receptor class A domain-containing protein 1-like n=1 Tax=Branchiostoma floridae TaxID=7739 RepID=A0A9J7N0U6_BRAFL|nr:MAM and LDL-receptor class A domain-containing protein 1-like [Branchiostoma floridae]